MNAVNKALHEGCYAALNLTAMLPSTDICDELKELLLDQWAIVTNELLKEEDISLHDYDLDVFVERCQSITGRNKHIDPFANG